MVELVGVHGLDEGHVIDEFAEVGQQFADPGAALAVALELVGRAEQLGVALDEGEALVLEQFLGAGLHVQLDQLGLVVEQLLLGRSARHVQINDALGLRREMGRTGRHRVVGAGGEIPEEHEWGRGFIGSGG